MANYRNSKLIERYEDIVFDLENALNTTPADGVRQIRNNIRFVVNNMGETTPYDWYNARIDMKFVGIKLADAGGNNVAFDNAGQGTVNSASSFIKKLEVKMNGLTVYDCDDANHATNIKNLLEYSREYSLSQATNEFFYLDTTRTAVAANTGFAARTGLLTAGGIANGVNVEIPLNRYGFFESLHGELLPNSRIELMLEIESDENLIWRSGGDAIRLVIKRFQLIVPRIIFNADGKSLYMSKFLDTRKWTYFRELVFRGESTRLQTSNYQITPGINKPRHVFVFFINDANDSNFDANKFLYNTFSPANQTLQECHLEVGNGKDYPDVYYQPTAQPARVFRDVLKYVHANNDYAGSTLLHRANFAGIFSMVYFDLTKQPTDIRDGMTKLVFKYRLSGAANVNYTPYTLVLYEQDVEIRKTDGKLTLRSM